MMNISVWSAYKALANFSLGVPFFIYDKDYVLYE